MNKIEQIHKTFHEELLITCQSYYTWKSIHNIVSSSKELYSSINENALSWSIILHSLQSTFFVSIGRILDIDSDAASIHLLFRTCKNEINLFNKQSLRARKVELCGEKAWIDKYISEAYEPKEADFCRLKNKTKKYTKLYEESYKPIRNKVFAHKDSGYIGKTDELFTGTDITSFEEILSSLYQVYMIIYDLYNNGRLNNFGHYKLEEKEYVLKDVTNLMNKLV